MFGENNDLEKHDGNFEELQEIGLLHNYILRNGIWP